MARDTREPEVWWHLMNKECVGISRGAKLKCETQSWRVKIEIRQSLKPANIQLPEEHHTLAWISGQFHVGCMKIQKYRGGGGDLEGQKIHSSMQCDSLLKYFLK